MRGRRRQSREIRLATGEARSVALEAGRTLICLEGVVWVTGDGPDDAILRPGQSIRPGRAVSLVLGGLRSAPARLLLMRDGPAEEAVAARPARPRLVVIPGGAVHPPARLMRTRLSTARRSFA